MFPPDEKYSFDWCFWFCSSHLYMQWEGLPEGTLDKLEAAQVRFSQWREFEARAQDSPSCHVADAYPSEIIMSWYKLHFYVFCSVWMKTKVIWIHRLGKINSPNFVPIDIKLFH